MYWLMSWLVWEAQIWQRTLSDDVALQPDINPIYVFMIYQQMLVKKISGCTYMQYYHRCVHKITAASETSAHKASTNRGRTFSSVSALITLIRPHRELLSLQGREHTSSILTTSNSYFNAFQYIASSPLFHSNPSYLIYYVPNSTINPINCSIVVNRLGIL